MALEEQLLTASIHDTLDRAYIALTRVGSLMWKNTSRNMENGEHAEEVAEADETLAYYIDKAFRDVGILAERLSLPVLRQEIGASRASRKNLWEVVGTPDKEGFGSEHLAEVHKFFASMEAMTLGREITGLGVFETVLHNTPKIIASRDLRPENEAQVRKAVRDTLKFCFRDVVREIPIAKNIKTFRPDIGVTSLMAAAEYKFISTEAKAKASLDEIFADMKGYSGHYAWRSFYAVLYMTSTFYTQKDVDAEFRVVNAEASWTPIVVVGPGRAKPSRKTSPAGTARKQSRQSSKHKR